VARKMDSKRARLDGGPSEEEILSLVAKRESARQARRFAESDLIREELRSMGVELYDKEKIWRARDGRRGTLFTAGAGECSLSDAEIQEYIREREEARSAKDWTRSDQLRDTMRQMGVELIDRDSIWRTSSGRSGTYGGGPVQPRPATATPEAITSLCPLGVSSIQNFSRQQITALISERERLRAAQDFEAADEMRRQLGALGVEIFDNERIWRTTSGEQGVIITGGHQVVCDLSDFDIAARVQQREDARNNKDWGSADTIRDELRQHGVELLDNQKVWTTTDGRQGNYGGQPMATAQYHPLMPAMTQATIGGVAGVDAGGLGAGGNAIAMAQLLAGQTQQFTSITGEAAAAAAAAQLAGGGNAAAMAQVQALLAQQQQLQQQQVHQMLPSPNSNPTNPVPRTPPPPASGVTWTSASILALVNGRELARDRHDWEAADAIRADLRSHGVDVWDKEKVWKASDGRSGIICRPGTSGVM